MSAVVPGTAAMSAAAAAAAAAPAPAAAAPAASPAASNAPTGSSPGTSEGGGTAQQAGAQPSTAAKNASAGDIRGWFNEFAGEMNPVDVAKFQTQEGVDLVGYDKANRAWQQEMQFRQGLIDSMGKPLTVGDTTIPGFLDRGEVESFYGFVNEISKNGLQPNHLIRLFRMESMLRSASQGGARAIEAATSAAQPGAKSIAPAGAQQQQSGGVVVPPAGTAGPDKPVQTRPGRVPSTSTLAQQMWGKQEAEQINKNPGLLFQPRTMGA